MHDPSRFLLIFGSVTGKAESIAELIAEEAIKRGFAPDLQNMDGVGKSFDLSKEKVVVMVSSTTGDGDQPENAERLWRKIKKRSLPLDHLAHIQFTILGLGDSNYTQFCNGPKTLHSRFLDLGAQSFYEPDWADDGVGLELVVEPWIENLWSALEKVLNITAKPVQSSVKGLIPKSDKSKTTIEESTTHSKTKIMALTLSELSDKLEGISLSNESSIASILKDENLEVSTKFSEPSLPGHYLQVDFVESEALPEEKESGPAYPQANTRVEEVPIVDIVKLTSDPRVKRAYLVTLDLSGTELDVKPGDSIGVICPNPENEVDLLLRRLELSDQSESRLKLSADPNGTKKNAKISDFLKSATTLRHLFTSVLDIRSVPKKPLIRVLAEYTSNPHERNVLSYLCSREGGTAYLSQIRGNQLCLLDILLALPSCQPPLSRLMEQLPRLMPRPYSSASTMKQKRVDFVFNTVDFERGNRRMFARRGLCTGWLEDLYSQSAEKRSKIQVYGRSNQNFRYPEDLSTPVIMIGPGTGVAPFRGFLRWREERKIQNGDAPLGPAWLFTGCRHKEADFLFSCDWKTWLDNGTLTRISSCFSRDDPQSNVRYVQHELKNNFKDVLEFMELDSKATIFVCGDARNMAKDVQQALVDGLATHKGIDKAQAQSIMADWIMAKRYLQDIWT